jgi:hypothetical protein
MAMAFDNEAEHDRLHARREDATHVRGVLEEARALATQAEYLLATLSRDSTDSSTFRMRLARAHALSLLDQLADLLEARPSGDGPALRGCPAPADDEDAVSAVRQAPWSRAVISSRTG